MPNQQIIDYLTTQQKQGYSFEQLRDVLIQNNYNQTEVDEAINFLKQSNQTNANKIESTLNNLENKNQTQEPINNIELYGSIAAAIMILIYYIYQINLIMSHTTTIPKDIVNIIRLVLYGIMTLHIIIISLFILKKLKK